MHIHLWIVINCPECLLNAHINSYSTETNWSYECMLQNGWFQSKFWIEFQVKVLIECISQLTKNSTPRPVYYETFGKRKYPQMIGINIEPTQTVQVVFFDKDTLQSSCHRNRTSHPTEHKLHCSILLLSLFEVLSAWFSMHQHRTHIECAIELSSFWIASCHTILYSSVTHELFRSSISLCFHLRHAFIITFFCTITSVCVVCAFYVFVYAVPVHVTATHPFVRNMNSSKNPHLRLKDRKKLIKMRNLFWVRIVFDKDKRIKNAC